MFSHRLLTHDEIFESLPYINSDQHLLFYSYLTQRKEKAQYFCQFVNNQLTAVLAYLSELSFPAFSFFRVEEQDIFFPELIAFTKETIQLDENAVCGTILCQQDLELFQNEKEGYGTLNTEITKKLKNALFKGGVSVISKNVFS